MRYQIAITEIAWANILDIGIGIRLHSPLRAETFVEELYERCISLREFPKSHSLIDDSKGRGIRRVIHGDYLIFFRIVDNTVEVLHVLHGARDYARLLFPEDGR